MPHLKYRISNFKSQISETIKKVELEICQQTIEQPMRTRDYKEEKDTAKVSSHSYSTKRYTEITASDGRVEDLV